LAASENYGSHTSKVIDGNLVFKKMQISRKNKINNTGVSILFLPLGAFGPSGLPEFFVLNCKFCSEISTFKNTTCKQIFLLLNKQLYVKKRGPAAGVRACQ